MSTVGDGASRRRWRRVAAALVLASTLLSGGLGTSASAAPAPAPASAASAPSRAHALMADGAGPLEIALTSTSSPTLTPQTRFRASGRIYNTGQRSLRDLEVRLRVDWPVLDAQDITEWAGRDPDRAAGVVWLQTEVPGPIAPGDRAIFDVEGPVAALGLALSDEAFGPRGMAIEVVGDDGTGRRRLAMERSFLIWDPVDRDQARPVTPLALLAPITSTLSAVRPESVPADPRNPDETPAVASRWGLDAAGRWAAEWSHDGRLTRVVAAAQDPAFSWALDPALLTAAALVAAEPAQTPNETPLATPSGSASQTGAGPQGIASTQQSAQAAGAGTAGAPSVTGNSTSLGQPRATPRVATSGTGQGSQAPAPSTSPGTSPADEETRRAARAFTQSLVNGSRDRDLHTLPWGDPDIVALARAVADPLLVSGLRDSEAVTREILGRAGEDTLTWPVDGIVDQATVRWIDRVNPGTVIVDPASVEPVSDSPSEPASSGPAVLSTMANRSTALRADPALGQAVAALANTDPTLAQQRLLAEIAARALPGQGQGSALLAALPRDWQPGNPEAMAQGLAVLRSQPWLELTSLQDLRERPATSQVGAVAKLDTRAAAAALPRGHVSAVASDLARLNEFRTVFEDPSITYNPMRATALSLVSTSWRRADLSARSRRTALLAARQPLGATVKRLNTAIGVEGAFSGQLLSASGTLPITVTNTLPEPVTVVLSLRPSSGVLKVGAPQAIRIEAATDGGTARASAAMQVKAVANAEVDVLATLSAPGADIGAPLVRSDQPIHLRVRPRWETGFFTAGGIVLASLFLFGLARSVRRGRRARIPSDQVPDPDDVGALDIPGRHNGTRGTAARITAHGSPQDVGTHHSSAHDASAHDGGQDRSAQDGAQDRPQTVRIELPQRGAPIMATSQVSAGANASAGAHPGAGPQSGATSEGAPSHQQASRPPGALSPDGAGPGAAAMNGSIPPGPPGPGGDNRGGESSGSGNAGSPDSAETADPEGSTSLMRNSAVMTAGILISRVLGMLRSVVLSAAIGAGAVLSADAFAVANTLPNQMYILIAGGVLNAVLVPQIVRAAKREDGGTDYIDRLMTLSFVLLLGATVLITAISPWLIHLLGRRWDEATLNLAVAFAYWCVPQMFFYGMYTVIGQILTARGSFAAYMWAPIVNNVVALLGLVCYLWLVGGGERPPAQWTSSQVALLAGTATLGVIAQTLVLIPALRSVGYRWRPRWGWRGIGLRNAGSVALWVFAGVAVAQAGMFAVITPVLSAAGQISSQDRIAAGRTVFDNAYLIFMLPHSLIAVSVVTALFPRISQQAADGELATIAANVSLALRTVAVATVFATVGGVVLAQEATATLFWGTPLSSTRQYGLVTMALLLGVVPYSAQFIFQRVSFAFEDARTPFLVGLINTGVWSLGTLISFQVLPARYVVVGSGASLALGALLSAVAWVPIVRSRLGTIDGPRLLSAHLRIIGAGVGAALVGWLVKAGAYAQFGDSRGAMALVLMITAAVMGMSYLLLLRALRVTELDTLIDPLMRRLRR